MFFLLPQEPGLFRILARAAATQKSSMNCGQEFDFTISEKRRRILLGEAPFILILVKVTRACFQSHQKVFANVFAV